jgi:hypothetical protein
VAVDELCPDSAASKVLSEFFRFIDLLLADAKQSKSNPNAGFVDWRDLCALRGDLPYVRSALQAALARPASSGEAGGTFACPICGFDKPHHHPEYDRMPVPFPSDPRNPQGVYGWVSDHIRHASGEYAVYNYLPPDQRTSRTIPLRAAMIDSSYTHPDEPVKVADGYVLVPREPTEAMLKAAYPLHWWDSPGQRLKQDYQKMLAATPGADGEAV